MIYELLTTALLAVSMGAIKPENPKRAFATASSLNGTITFGCLHNDNIEPNIELAMNGYTSGVISANDQGNLNYKVADSQGDIFSAYWNFSDLGRNSHITGYVMLYFSDKNVYEDFSNNGSNYISYSSGAYDDGVLGNGYNGHNYEIEMDWTAEVPNQASNYSFTITFDVPSLETYEVTKTFTNCHWSGNTDHNIPDTYTANEVSNPYSYYVVANTGCYFKTDGSGITTSGGLEVVSINYGNYPTISHLIYTTEIELTLNLPLSDCSITLTAINLSVQDVNDLYGAGFDDAKSIYGENVQFNWIKTAFDGMATFFNIEVLPNITLGFLMFAPIVVVAIVAIVRIIKHE